MSERPFTPPGDDELDAALRARRRLLPRFDAHVDEEPSPELDRRVLSRAREALGREAPPDKHYRNPRWAAPVAIAATVLLSLGLVLQMDPSRNDAVLDAGDAATATATTEPAVPEQSAEPADAAAVSMPKAAATPTPAALAAPPTPAAPPQAAPPAATPYPVPPPAAPPRDRATQAAREPAAEPAPAAEARIESVAESRGAAAVGSTDVTRRTAGPEVDRAAKSAPPGAASGSSTTSAAEFAESAAADIVIPRDDPQRWLAAIEQLRVAGDVDAARRELAVFRRRHPGVPLPDALDALH